MQLLRRLDSFIGDTVHGVFHRIATSLQDQSKTPVHPQERCPMELVE
jgi:hypothetical protein